MMHKHKSVKGEGLKSLHRIGPGLIRFHAEEQCYLTITGFRVHVSALYAVSMSSRIIDSLSDHSNQSCS
jgi:hypothetical protein